MDELSLTDEAFLLIVMPKIDARSLGILRLVSVKSHELIGRLLSSRRAIYAWHREQIPKTPITLVADYVRLLASRRPLETIKYMKPNTHLIHLLPYDAEVSQELAVAYVEADWEEAFVNLMKAISTSEFSYRSKKAKYVEAYLTVMKAGKWRILKTMRRSKFARFTYNPAYIEYVLELYKQQLCSYNDVLDSYREVRTVEGINKICEELCNVDHELLYNYLTLLAYNDDATPDIYCEPESSSGST